MTLSFESSLDILDLSTLLDMWSADCRFMVSLGVFIEEKF